MTKDIELYKCVLDNFKYHGQECTYIEVPISDKKAKKLQSPLFKLKLFYKTKIERKEKYIKRYTNLFSKEDILKQIDEISEQSNKCLMIRPDVYPIEVVQKLNKLIPNTIGYQWDGLDRFPKIHEYIPIFKKFLIYDKNDLKKYDNCSLTTNFYFDCYINENKTNPEYDVYYIGSYDNRINDVIELCEKLHNLKLKLKILIYCSKKNREKIEKYPFITVLRSGLTYKENLKNVFNCKTILDFGHKTLHNGLSLRPFEALGYHKKLITTNTSINQYDFFNKKNIMIYKDEIDEIKIKDFIHSSYQNIEETVYKKYSFNVWFDNNLN